MAYTQEQTVNVVLELIKIACNIKEPLYMEHQKYGKLLIQSRDFGKQIDANLFCDKGWHSLFYIRKNIEANYNYMKCNPGSYHNVVLYSSDDKGYWLIDDGKTTFCPLEEVQDSSFYFNLNISTGGILLSRNVMTQEKFRVTQEATDFLSKEGYQLIIYEFPDEITHNLIKVLEEGILKK